ncbi:MAG: flagellar FliJ family protein [Candidatus Cloacimonetes bacterium]|nr:flagellar FliJ family protein [Candidatus Cloacimonadota bacterium]
MKKFTFRLAVVKKLKERKVDEQKDFLFESQKKFEEEQKNLKVLHDEKRSVRDCIIKFKQELDFHRAEHAKAYEDGVDYKIVSQELKLQDAYGAVKYAERLLEEAVKEVKIYEKLEEKAIREYKKERLLFEQEQIDDISLILRAKRGK